MERPLTIRQATVGHPKDPIYRVRTMAFDNKKDADTLCAELRDLGLECLVFQSRSSVRPANAASGTDTPIDPADAIRLDIEDVVGAPDDDEGVGMDPFDWT